jgi:hypothetical protein
VVLSSLFLGDGVMLSPLCMSAITGPLYQPLMMMMMMVMMSV